MTPLPPAVRDLAARLGTLDERPVRSVRMRQAGALRNSGDQPFRRFRAVQQTDVGRCNFVWRASMGPFGLVRVVDSLSAQGARLQASLAGVVTLARAEDSPQVRRGEIMRYLAEIPWNPDAILRNRDLEWAVEEKGLRVAAGKGASRGSILFELDSMGRIAGSYAPDRPRLTGSGFVETPWRGRFGEYRQVQGRTVPGIGEVAWLDTDGEQIVWRGKLLDWRAD